MGKRGADRIVPENACSEGFEDSWEVEVEERVEREVRG